MPWHSGCLAASMFLGGGVPQDLNAAEKWLKPAADGGYPFAADYLVRVMEEPTTNKLRHYTKSQPSKAFLKPNTFMPKP
jgi:TPR repeat protein